MSPDSLAKLGFGALLVVGLWIVTPIVGKVIDKFQAPQREDKLGPILLEMKNHMGVIESTLNIQAQTLASMASVLAVIEDRTRN